MSNPSKAKGTRAETLVKDWLTARGFDARGVRLHGNVDHGDIHLVNYAVVIEVKWSAATPAPAMLDGWLGEATQEAHNFTVERYPQDAMTYHPVLVHNRQRSRDVGNWRWYLWSPLDQAWMFMDGWQFVQRLLDDMMYGAFRDDI